jgi:hypothetical protein
MRISMLEPDGPIKWEAVAWTSIGHRVVHCVHAIKRNAELHAHHCRTLPLGAGGGADRGCWSPPTLHRAVCTRT